MPTIKAAFGTGIPLVDSHDSAPIPGCFVLQLADQLAPAHVADGFGKHVIFQHPFHVEAFHTQHLVFVDQACGQLVEEVLPPICNAGMDASDALLGFGSVLGAFLLAAERPLRSGEVFFILMEELFVPCFLARRKRDGIVQAQTNPYGLRGDSQRLEVLFHQEGNEVASGGIPGDGDRGGLNIFGQRTTPANGQGLLHSSPVLLRNRYVVKQDAHALHDHFVNMGHR